MPEVIITNKCESCIYGSIIEESKAKIKVYCSNKEKEYYYGACIQCDSYKRRKEKN